MYKNLNSGERLLKKFKNSLFMWKKILLDADFCLAQIGYCSL